MKQLSGVVAGLSLCFAMMLFGPAGAVPAANAKATTNQLVNQTHRAKKQVKKARQKQRAVCRKAAKAKRGKAGRKSLKRCRAAKRNVRKKRRMARRAIRRLNSNRYFDVCRHGCLYRTVQAGANDAGRWQYETRRHNAVVRVQPGTYVEGVFVYTERKKLKRDFDGMTIMGVTKNRRPLKDAGRVLLEGRDAKTVVKGNDPYWKPGDDVTKPAQNAIEARNVKDFKIRNMQGRNYLNNVFFVWASTNPAFNERCEDYEMDNLIANDTRAYGLFARNCFGGVIKNSEGWGQGDSAVYIGETPCDDPDWTGKTGKPCQRNPRWTVIDNVKSHLNTLGYSGTNSKYVEIKNSAWYNNGAGIVPNTLDSERFEPAGWMKIHDNDIFWNNHNYQSTGSKFTSIYEWSDFAPGGLGEVAGRAVNFPMGVGVMLFGNDGIEVYDNDIFGNEKWGALAFSAPVAETIGIIGNIGDDAKNLNNSFTGNRMGRDGLDPNGTDFFSDFSGGGNCWSGNLARGGVTYALNPDFMPPAAPSGPTRERIYPECPQPRKMNNQTFSLNLSAGLQVTLDGAGDPTDDPRTIVGYATQSPAKHQECSWSIPSPATGNNRFHPPFTDRQGYEYREMRADPVTDCAP